MPSTVYLDTSVILHLTDPPSPNPITRACQQLTQLWWHTRCVPSMTYVSDQVTDELEQGDPLRLAMRLKTIAPLIRLPDNNQIKSRAELLILGGGLKAVAGGPSQHIAYAALNRNDILLTWNCRDIANATKLPLLRFLMVANDLTLPELVTPFELMENSHENLWQRDPGRFGIS
ncbi:MULTISPECIES: type II toxin-antitoxin system VapC family toxin [unclassified Duganella]|uniref:type II toxin-antitoxin system VapC family toxin n=1 Tax=unclassified Duganella TaxID=2636909 RepID=UPI0011C0DBF0|nr:MULTISPECIES: type II toxin-antitoxin system VapC family toxin [unclassified Duganella]